MDPVSTLLELAEMAYDGRHPSISIKRAAALSQAADDLQRFREALQDIEQFGHRNPGYGWSCANKASAALGIAAPKKGPARPQNPPALPVYSDLEDEPEGQPIQWSGEQHSSASSDTPRGG